MLSFIFGGRSKRLALLASSVLAVAAVCAAAAPGAQAAFDLSQCQGGDLSGTGSSLQVTAQAFWDNANFQSFCSGAFGHSISYTSSDSGTGRSAMGANTNGPGGTGLRDANFRFGGTDNPPTPTDVSEINAGGPGTTDDGLIHIVPVTQAAITVDVNVPAVCDTIISGNASLHDSTGRLILPNLTIAHVFDGTFTTWGQVLNDNSDSGNPNGCDQFAVRRIVRFDSSGTTFVLKTFLNHIEPANPAIFSTSANTTWPNNAGQTAGATCATPVLICSSGANGGGTLGTLLAGTPGGFGYMDLATARGKSFDFTGTLGDNTAGTDSTFWMPIEATGNGAKWVDPTADVNGWKTGSAGIHGANCIGTTYNGVPAGPDATLGDWSAVDGTAPTQPANNINYPLCTLTFDLAFDDNAPVYGNTPTEEAKARTLKDLLTSIVSGSGQAQLGAQDYAPLPTSIDTIAQTGVAAIGWNKSADQSNNTPPPTQTPTPTPTPTVPLVVTPPPPPSNKFSITSAKVSSSKKLVLSLQLPGKGTVRVTAKATYKSKTLSVASKSASVAGGTGSVTLTPSSATTSALKRVKSLTVTISVTFTPTGGTAATKTAHVTLKGKVVKPKPKHKKH